MTDTAIKIAALGDIMLDRSVGKHFFENPRDFELPEIRNLLDEYDLVIANLENPVGLRGEPFPRQDPNVAFRCHPETLKVLKNLGVDVVTIANNHLLDYGAITLLDTLDHLDNAGIRHVGGGKNYNQANQPALFEINGRKLALLASVMVYSASTERATNHKPGVADFRIKPLLKRISELKAEGYLVLVTVHWGIEYCFYPIPYQRQQAQAMIEAGASAIIGHGPHFPQGIERFRHGEIVHSLGNFIFDEPYPNSRKSFIYCATLGNDGRILDRKVHPVTLHNHLPVLDPEGIKSRTGFVVSNLHRLYARKNRHFWKKINSRWFTDIAWRVTSMRSLKFIFLPPLSFYFSIGLGNFLKKLKISNLKWLFGKITGKIFSRPKMIAK